MMFPTLRGGNTDAGGKEFFFGEVDDVLAAAEHLAELPYVDAQYIYLGGHSTGGTLALLTAEASTRFKAVFAFGAVSRIDRYPASLVPDFDPADSCARTRLRSPIHWLDGITTPTWLIEGTEAPGNHDELDGAVRPHAQSGRALHFGAGVRSLQRARARVARHRRATRPWPTRESSFRCARRNSQRAGSD